MIDKSSWGDGPWQGEPDLVEWRVGELYCLVRRVEHSGHLCGYVGVPPGHPWFGQTEETLGVDCHGGVTFSSVLDDWEYAPHCPVGYYVVGFDCGHAGDLTPAIRALLREMGHDYGILGDVYRRLTYVTELVFGMVRQAIPTATVPGVLGLNVTDGVARFEYSALVGFGWPHIPMAVSITGDGQRMVENYVKGLIPLEIVADWLYDHQDEVGLGGIDRLHERIMAFGVPERPKVDPDVGRLLAGGSV